MILLDTHVLIWWINETESLSPKVQKIINQEKSHGTIFVSSISIWEIYMLVQKERLQLTMDCDSWIEKIESLDFLQFVPVDNRIMAKSVMLPGQFHADPADRIIVATAREKGIILVTKDDRIRKYPHVQTIW
jgi:PIN domain nuclease of toxin-antitoxin system